jgi:hypothetical protein
MTQKEYEERYAAALDKIRRTIVGNPETLHDGTRLVIIDGKSCTDEVVFTKAWGRDAAEEIMKRKPR